MSLSATFTLLNISSDNDSTTSLGSLFQCLCPGFSQDRVNFHQNPGRGTAGRADPTPTWPNRVGYSMPCAVMLGSGGQGGAGGSHSWLGRAQRRCGPREQFCSAGLFCVIPSSVSLLFLFPLFAVLLNCPYPDPPVSACFLSILLCTPVGGGAAAWRFCCRLQPKPEQLDNSFSEEIFPNIQSKPPHAQLEAISSHPITSYLGKETNKHSAINSN